MMELRVVKKDKNLLEIEIKDESVGFGNLIKDGLWEDKNVAETACIKEHPYMVEPKIYMKMKGKSNPVVSLKKVNQRISNDLKELKGKFKKALKD